MALQYDEIKKSQTANPPTYNSQGMVNSPVKTVESITTPNYDPTQWGIDPSIWQALGPSGQAFIESATGILQQQQNNGNFQASVNHDLFQQALDSAKTDPNIAAKYGDAAKVDEANLVDSLSSITGEFNQQQAAYQRQFEQDRKNLADQYAEAGLAQSGFRQKAKQNLEASQNDIIQSSRRQLQGQLTQLGRPYEAKYGADAIRKTGIPTVADLSYKPLGLTGSNELSKKQDIYNQGVQNYNQEKL